MEREEAQSNEGKGKIADERKGMMERGKVSSEVRQSKKRRKEGRQEREAG